MATVERTMVGSVVSFEDFYRADYRSLLGLAYVLTGNRGVAEDLVQDAFTEAHRRWDKISQYDNPGAWVRRVLVNKSTSRGRRLISEAKAITRIRATRPTPIVIKEASEEVWAAVRKLPKRQAQAVVLRYWQDLSVQQVADVLGCKPETAKTHLKRGRAALAVALDETAEEDE